MHGIRAFVPRFVEQGEGHVVNTASVAGLKALPFAGPYTATKHAVVGVSEDLALELMMLGAPVRVSVLCPGFIKTRLVESERNWPAELGERPKIEDSIVGEALRGLVEGGTSAADLAQRVVAAVREDHFFILSDPEHAWVPEQRGHGAIRNAKAGVPGSRHPESGWSDAYVTSSR